MNDPSPGPGRTRKAKVRRRAAGRPGDPESRAPAAGWRAGRDWHEAVIAPGTSILEALRVLDKSRLQIVLVADGTRKLQGIATDGDIRRAILKGTDLGEPVGTVIERNYFFVSEDTHRLQLFETMMRREIRRAPMLDRDGRVIDLICIEDLVNPEPLGNVAVLMAGGLGTRLRPLTAGTPKPMVPVGHQPVLETILTQLKLHGFRRVYLAVNHRSRVIEDYFGDGAEMELDICYLRERERLGTAGPLSLLPERPDKPLLVMNGDLLTRLNFLDLLDFHDAQGVAATVCLGEHWYEVPYGVAEVGGDRVLAIDEKPMQRFQVSAGINVLNPDVLDLIPVGEPSDMPALIERLLANGQPVAAFPIRDYWIDIGRIEDLQRAHASRFGL